MYLTVEDFSLYREDLMPLVIKQIKQLRLFGLSKCTLYASGEFPYCPLFTHFSVYGYHIDDSVPAAFMKAVKDGKLPNLRRIELNKNILVDFEWPKVPEFSLHIRKNYDISQIRTIISQLTELTLGNCSNISHVISDRLEKLTVLGEATNHNLLKLNNTLRDVKLSTLSANSSEEKTGRIGPKKDSKTGKILIAELHYIFTRAETSFSETTLFTVTRT